MWTNQTKSEIFDSEDECTKSRDEDDNEGRTGPTNVTSNSELPDSKLMWIY